MSEQYEHAIILNVNIGSMTLSRGQWTKQITSFHSSWKVENFGLWYTKAERILKEREVEICEELLQQKIVRGLIWLLPAGGSQEDVQKHLPRVTDSLEDCRHPRGAYHSKYFKRITKCRPIRVCGWNCSWNKWITIRIREESAKYYRSLCLSC